LLFGVGALVATGFPPRARIYPLFVGVVGVLLASAELFLNTRMAGGDDGAVAARSLSAAARQIRPYLVWLLGYLILSALIGLILASGVFVALFLRRAGGTSVRVAAMAFWGVLGFLVVAGAIFGLHWPASIIDPIALLGLS